MLYLAIPAHNEVATIGVLLWRLRTVLAEFPREYEVVVYDDASTDETAAVAEQYVHAMPVTVLRGAAPVGYAGAVDALVRHVAAHTRYPRRDAMLLLQGDFTDPPGIVPEFARRFEGGADVVVGERTAVVDAPVPVRRLFSAAGWALRPFVRVEGVRDLTGSMRLMRIQALRDLLRTVGDDPVCQGDSWTANADLLLRLVPHARRVETVPVEPTYGVRTRDTRRVTVRDALAALHWGWRARGRRAVPTSVPDTGGEPVARGARPAPPSSRRRDEPEVTADRLRERSRDRERLRGDVDAPPARREGRPDRDRRDGARVARTEEQKAERRERNRNEKPEQKVEQPPRPRREERADEPRAPRPPRPERQPRRGRQAPLAADADMILEDPFAGPATRATAGPLLPVPSPAPTPEPSPATADVNDFGTDDEVDDRLDDASAGADAETDADTGDDTTPDARERKRRRNRRSRRRRSKQRGDADASAEPAADEASAEDAGPYRSERPRRDDDDTEAVDRASGSDLRDDTDGDGDRDTDDGSAADGDEASEGGSDIDRAARARRRGRRGRRGGSRRSRGRGRDGAERDGAGSDDSTGEPPSAPPPGDAE